jgi:hypothetical protein
MKTTIVSWLLYLYPKAWRAEYGDELRTMLLARPLTAAIVVDIARSAMWQRLRVVLPPTWVGIGLMLVTIWAIASMMVAPPPYVRSVLSERIELVQKPLQSEFYVLVLFAIGFWTAVAGKQSPARAAMRASMIASIPLALIGLLMLTGLLPHTELVPGQKIAMLNARGIVYPFYKGLQQIPAPAPLTLLLSPLLRLPGAWLWGTVGGSLGRKYVNWRGRPIGA